MTGFEPPTIVDIARLSGVSTASASRALNGRPGVSAATRAVILKVAEDLNYTLNASARALSTGRTGRVAITLPEVETEYFARILAGAAETFQAQGLSLTIATTAHSHDRQVRSVKDIVRAGADGALFILPSESVRELEELRASNFPFVVVDAVEQMTSHVVWVTTAHAQGAGQAVEHLLALGHRRLAVITGEPDQLATTERLHGVRQALRARGLDLDPALVATCTYHGLTDPSVLTGLLDVDEPPTAVFAFNDRLAFGVLQEAARLGLRVPEDLSVVGFDDLEATRWVTPTLTTVRQPLTRMGAVAADLLLQWIDGRRPEAMHVALPAELIVRASTAEPSR
jgi:LacI family transcriptional regulator